jgi:SAM-dependent methyltransferase
MKHGDRLRDHVVCARCATAVHLAAPTLACSRCGQVYTRVGRIPVLMPRPDDQVRLWRHQLGLLMAQGQETALALAAEDASSDLSPTGHARMRALAQGVRDQMSEIVRLLGPALGGPLEALEGGDLPRGVVEYSAFLYRDWGWENGGHPENQQSVDAIRNVFSGESLGRTLVLGAGGCRLAYDLHRLLGATETAVVDIDPFLLVIAEAVIRGEPVRLTESTANVQDMANIARPLVLAPPAGPLDPTAFHFFLANGLRPPFADGAFDTVVTPWFIDQVPTELRSFLATLRALLRPGGRWINHGPLVYPSDAPMARRFSREEVFELATHAGFQVDRWSCGSQPHLVSPLNGRGKMEWVLTFEGARRLVT